MEMHPFHLHTTPFQLMWTSKAYPWAMPGDWLDTLLIPEGGAAVVRFQTDEFVGRTVMHCHFLPHEDRGCMATVLIDGEEGTPAKVTSDSLQFKLLSSKEYVASYQAAADLLHRFRGSYDATMEKQHEEFME